jgi:hypothetical protein
VEYVPGSQAVQFVEEASGVYVPGGQSEQLDGDGAARRVEKVPATQATQAVALVLFW